MKCKDLNIRLCYYCRTIKCNSNCKCVVETYIELLKEFGFNKTILIKWLKAYPKDIIDLTAVVKLICPEHLNTLEILKVLI